MSPEEQFEVKLDEDELMKLERQLADVPGGMERAVQGAINKTLRSLRSRITKRISNATGIKQKAIRDGMIIKRATRAYLKGLVVFGDDRIPLVDLKARQTQKGITFQSEGGERDLVPDAFKATMPSGHKGVFKRKGQEDLVPRLPIYELYGPSLTGIFDKAYQVRADVMEQGSNLLNHYMLQEVNRLVERYS